MFGICVSLPLHWPFPAFYGISVVLPSISWMTVNGCYDNTATDWIITPATGASEQRPGEAQP